MLCTGLQRFQRRDRDEGRRDGGRDSGAGADRERQRRERLQQQKRGQWNAYWQDKNAPRIVYNSSVIAHLNLSTFYIYSNAPIEGHGYLHSQLSRCFTFIPFLQLYVYQFGFSTLTFLLIWNLLFGSGGYSTRVGSSGTDSSYSSFQVELRSGRAGGHVNSTSFHFTPPVY